MISGNVIDEVGFEQDTFTANVQVKQLQPGMQDIFEVVRIRFDAEDSHPGPWLFTDDAVLGFL
jgi:hypothetical protein